MRFSIPSGSGLTRARAACRSRTGTTPSPASRKLSRPARSWVASISRHWLTKRLQINGATLTIRNVYAGSLAAIQLLLTFPVHNHPWHVKACKGAIREKNHFGCLLVGVGFERGACAETDRRRRNISLPHLLEVVQRIQFGTSRSGSELSIHRFGRRNSAGNQGTGGLWRL